MVIIIYVYLCYIYIAIGFPTLGGCGRENCINLSQEVVLLQPVVQPGVAASVARQKDLPAGHPKDMRDRTLPGWKVIFQLDIGIFELQLNS